MIVYFSKDGEQCLRFETALSDAIELLKELTSHLWGRVVIIVEDPYEASSKTRFYFSGYGNEALAPLLDWAKSSVNSFPNVTAVESQLMQASADIIAAEDKAIF